MGTSRGWGEPAWPWSPLWAAGESLLQPLGLLLPLLLLSPWCAQGCFSHLSLSLLTAGQWFCTILNTFSRGIPRGFYPLLSCGAQLCPVVGTVWVSGICCDQPWADPASPPSDFQPLLRTAGQWCPRHHSFSQTVWGASESKGCYLRIVWKTWGWIF